jgi:hypothetical protein
LSNRLLSDRNLLRDVPDVQVTSGRERHRPRSRQVFHFPFSRMDDIFFGIVV